MIEVKNIGYKIFKISHKNNIFILITNHIFSINVLEVYLLNWKIFIDKLLKMISQVA